MTYTRDWNPKLVGDVYCSPACGCKCTHHAFERATADAEELVAELGERWKVRVWENMGWYYSAEHKDEPISISQHGDTYTCYYNAAHQRLGRGGTAVEAFEDAVDKMTELRDELTRSLETL